MYGYDQQLQMASTLAKTFTDMTSSALQASTAFWTGAKAPDPARSWYRPPAANPFDLNAWGTGATSTMAPWSAWGTTFNPAAMMLPNAQSWSALASFATAMAAMQPVQSYWASFMPGFQPPAPQAMTWQSVMWPMAQFGAIAAAMASPAKYSNYRSEGGHATAQITFVDPTSRASIATRLH